MNEQSFITTNNGSFKAFLLKNKRNRITLMLAAIAIVIQFGIFKYLYPFASFIHGDSFAYIRAAEQNLTINTYLIGYSKFLRLFSVFAKPDYILVAFQYLFIQGSVLFLLFTLFYFYRPGKVIQTILLCFMVFNPLFLHLGNMVSSDGFFLSLSCIWFALLLWIIHRPSNKIIIWQAIILFIAFTFRYNAIIYPVVAGVAFYLSRLPLRKKMVGIGLGLLLMGLFVGFTMNRYKKLTGYWQYSPFSGWQLANNAMYAFRSVDSADRKPVPEKFQVLHTMICEYFDSTRDVTRHPIEKMEASTYYMWSPNLSLMKYRDSLFKKDTVASELKKWASMGPFYKEYGLYIIRQYPWHFIQYFMWPNSQKYYAPPVEFLESYNGGREGVTESAKNWFGYKSTKVTTRMTEKKVWVLDFYPILSGIINVVMICVLLCYIQLKGWKQYGVFNKAVLMGGFFWLLNASFTIWASSAALRFQSFPVIVTTIFCLLLLDWMVQLAKRMNEDKLQSYNDQKQMEKMLQSGAI
jgi:hypothetical protein